VLFEVEVSYEGFLSGENLMLFCSTLCLKDSPLLVPRVVVLQYGQSCSECTPFTSCTRPIDLIYPIKQADITSLSAPDVAGSSAHGTLVSCSEGLGAMPNC
jgi:hypothetical protein